MSAVVAITAFRLTTAMSERLTAFYGGLGFQMAEPTAIPSDEMELLGLDGAGIRTSMRLGGQTVDLDQFERSGAPASAVPHANATSFQHLALVTSDAVTSWSQAKALGARPISTSGPVTLPATSGGVTAIKFCDPEGHPLEFLQFPANIRTHWRGTGLLGIDHSGIVASDVAASSGFYHDLGLVVGDATVNRGETQDGLDGLNGTVVDVVPLFPRQQTPHLELLCYRSPKGAPISVLAANDAAATRTVWSADRDALIWDPDGHLHLLRR